MFERPETLTPAYVNHAHDEYVEVWMEAGVPGVALIGGFWAWWAVASRAVLRRRDAGARLALAGSVVVGMLLVHSMVDYPLRTPAMAVVFALACGLMSPHRRGSRRWLALRSTFRETIGRSKNCLGPLMKMAVYSFSTHL